MSNNILKPFFILGPTGCGKSGVAIALAELLLSRGQLCEIVSADAYQIYKGVPLITACPCAEDLSRVPHHLIQCLDLCERHDAALHARLAECAIKEVQGRGALPVVVGGSGLYVKFISHGVSPAPPSDAVLRARLESLSSEDLIAQFALLDPEGLAMTAQDNRRYLVRNLEIVLLTGRGLRETRENWQTGACGLGVSLVRDVDDLNGRIASRAAEMIDGGLLEEVAALDGLCLSATAEKILGLSLVRRALQKDISLPKLQELLTIETRQYAKRQRTWLRRESWLSDVSLTNKSMPDVLEEVLGFVGL